MRIWIGVFATLTVLALSRPAHAQQAVGVGPTQQFAGIGNINNNQFIYPNVLSTAASTSRMNLSSTGLFDRITHMSFFQTQYNGYNASGQQYPDMGMAYLQTFGYRVAQPAK